MVLLRRAVFSGNVTAKNPVCLSTVRLANITQYVGEGALNVIIGSITIIVKDPTLGIT